MKKKFLMTYMTLAISLTSVGISDAHEVERVSGRSRVDTAVEISKKIFKDLPNDDLSQNNSEENNYDLSKNESTENTNGLSNVESIDNTQKLPNGKSKENNQRVVVLANAYSYVDALPGAVLANAYGGSLLLTKGDTLSSSTSNEIERIKPSKIFILGGEGSISKAIEEDINSRNIETIRIGGHSRYETSELIAKEIEKKGSIKGLLIVSNEADAVSASSIAKNNMPIVLVRKKSAYVASKNVKKVVLGGTGSVSDELYSQLGSQSRINGKNRYETALMIAKQSDYENLIIVNGKNIIDGLTAGTLSYKNSSAIILTNGKSLRKSVFDYVNSKNKKITIVGGENSVKSDAINKITPDLANADSIQKPKDKNSFEYWDYYNNYSDKLIYTEDQIRKLNIKNSKKSKYINDVLDLKVKYYAVAARRTVLKNSPVSDSSSSDRKNDYEALTAVFPWDELAIIETSPDNKSFKVVSSDYQGWLPKKDVMVVGKNVIENKRKNQFITITSRQIKSSDGRLLDMGTYLPLVRENKDSFDVLMPVAGDSYRVKSEKIYKTNSVKGFLPFTQKNVIRQSLKFQGEKYGWGHSNTTRDCTGFIRDVYRSFGIKMARDTKQQSTDVVGESTLLTGTRTNKENILSRKLPGNTVYLPGHAFIYLGKDENGVMNMVHSYGTKYSNGKILSIFKNEISGINTFADSQNTFLGYSTVIKDFYKLD